MTSIRRTVLLIILILSVVLSMPFSLVYAQDNDSDETAAEETVQSDGISEEAEDTEYISEDSETGCSAEEYLSDNNDLLQQYLDRSFFGVPSSEQTVLFRKKAAGDNLTGNNAQLYGLLKSFIESIVSGDRTQTVLTISMSDLGLDTAKTWTAEELGVERIVSGGVIDKDAKTAVYAYLNIDFPKVVKSLIYDLPYDLFWFDKTIGYSYSSFSIGARRVNGEYVIYLTGVSTVKFSVAEEFRYENEQYRMDGLLIESINSTADNAKRIVEAHKDESDYEKLDSYREEICEAVSYNYDAAWDDGMPYGNPWQLIWVFDDDPETNVVCEGYSKAFQYLCDLTDFRRDIECITVTGKMNGGTGSGGHMWNIVTMEDRKHYLTDITNCDSGSIGSTRSLLMTGALEYELDRFRVEIKKTDTYGEEYIVGVLVYTYDTNTKLVWEETNALELSEKPYVYDPNHVWIDEISLNQTAVTIKTGESEQLSAYITPEDATNQNVFWKSDNENVATVDETGKVSAVSKGTTVIWAVTEEGQYTASCTVDVIVPVSGITVEEKELTAVIGEPARIVVTFEPLDASNQNVLLYSDNDSITVTDSNGTFIGNQVGKTRIKTVSEDGGFEDDCDVRVLFKDTADPDKYYYDAVYWAVDKGITQGTSPTTFNPGGFCKRYQFVLFLWRQAGQPEPTLKTDPFTDVKADPKKNAYEKAVLWAVEKGITTGTTKITFDPYAPLTRGQVVTFLYRAAEEPPVTITANPFRDLDSSKYYYKPVLWAVEKGITTGLNATQFGPTNTCTRGQTVVFMHRMFR